MITTLQHVPISCFATHFLFRYPFPVSLPISCFVTHFLFAKSRALNGDLSNNSFSSSLQRTCATARKGTHNEVRHPQPGISNVSPHRFSGLNLPGCLVESEILASVVVRSIVRVIGRRKGENQATANRKIAQYARGLLRHDHFVNCREA
jgi:hypothetical protein